MCSGKLSCVARINCLVNCPCCCCIVLLLLKYSWMLLYARDSARGRNGCNVPWMVGRGSCYTPVAMASKGYCFLCCWHVEELLWLVYCCNRMAYGNTMSCCWLVKWRIDVERILMLDERCYQFYWSSAAAAYTTFEGMSCNSLVMLTDGMTTSFWLLLDTSTLNLDIGWDGNFVLVIT